jgi:methylglutamate dehydrogenase subunit D
VFERYSALTGVSGSARIGESRGWALVQAAAFAGTHSEFRQQMRAALGADLPTTVGTVLRVGNRQLLKTGSEQYWIITREGDDFAPLIRAEVGAVTALSHSRTCIFVEAEGAGAILAKGVPLDFHPDSFRIDQFALTGLHHTPVLIHRSGAQRFDIYALRTYAQTVWEWLEDAA